MDELKYWLAFNSIHKLGSISIMKIYNHFKSLKEAWSASSADLHRVHNITPTTIEKIVSSRHEIVPDKLLEETIKQNISICCLLDNIYPEILKEIHNPPVVLYYKGDLQNCDFDKTIAIVGTRIPSDYGRQTAYQLSKKLSENGITVISGLAEGIDTSAHTACIQQGGKTIAVLGSGLNQIYPKINVHLAKRIYEGNYGAVISEYNPNTPPESWRFPYRNRIISGLSKATIVVESKARGGALITAKYALEQNREVFGVPSKILDDSNAGTHNLIKRGEARLLTSYSSLFEHLNWEILKNDGLSGEPTKNPKPLTSVINDKKGQTENKTNEKRVSTENKKTYANKKTPQTPTTTSSTEQLILNSLTTEALQFDIILQKTNLKASDLLSSLTMLELKGFIKQIEGKRYRKNF